MCVICSGEWAADGADLWGLVSGDAVGGVRAGKTATALLLGVPLLVGRKKDGKLFAMRDLCPHRGIPLSAGWFDGETVTVQVPRVAV